MGIALLHSSGDIWSRRTVGRINALVKKMGDTAIESGAGIAHTRWATHGIPSETNAHPHISNASVAVVHNGIIENYRELKRDLESQGYIFSSDTDTEVIAHLIQSFMVRGFDLKRSVRSAMDLMHGSYAIGVISKSTPNCLIAAKKGSPLVIGYGAGEAFMASDVSALIKETQNFAYLDDGDMAVITNNGVKIFDIHNNPASREISVVKVEEETSILDEHQHYMHREIYHQPKALINTYRSLEATSPNPLSFLTKEFASMLTSIKMVACGTSYNAALIAKLWLEGIAGVPCDVEVASEFRYRDHVVRPGTLFITVSQSGETADTLAALNKAKEMGYVETLSVCNVSTSSLARLSGITITTEAGPEIGVASTKGFTTQLMALLILTVNLSLKRYTASGSDVKALYETIGIIDSLIKQVLDKETVIKDWGFRLAKFNHAIFLGRGTMYPVALEGALKLKETSYMQVDAYPSGELKHGPLALVDEKMPVIAMVLDNHVSTKIMSNLLEVKARGGEIFLIADENVSIEDGLAAHIIRLPHVDDLIAPIIYTIPLQLLAYHTAVTLGTDVDKPRNLAKSVTVE
jgi:glucosamine--fructose-6-phosphate aminotransferase (isomerizing)